MMAPAFLKVRIDFDEWTEALTDEEKARLLLAMLRYARTGEEPALEGAERILWPVFRTEIDHENAVIETHRESGKKGGRPPKEENQTKPDETKQNQTKPNETKQNQTKPNETNGFGEKEREEERESEEDKEKERSKERVTEEEKEREQEKEKETTSRAREEAADRRMRFDQFWAIYPRKEGKKSALKEWEKIRPGPDLVNTILAALTKQKNSEQWRRDGGQYIPHPSTWLHGERWNDETIQPARLQSAAQDYEQRDYSGIQDEIRRRMIAAIGDSG